MAKRDPQAPVTNEVLDDAISHVVETLGGMIEALAQKVDTLTEKVEELAGGQQRLETGQQDLKRQINDLKVDTPTQKEFDQLKAKVEHHHPTN